MTVPAFAVKVLLLAPAATVTPVGIVSVVLLSESVTRDPLAGAVPVKVTVQVLLALDERVVGLHFSDNTVSDGEIVIDAVLELPFRLAVKTAV